MNYIKVTFELEPLLPAREVLYADLELRNFESIVDTDKGAEAYIPEMDFTPNLLSGMMVQDMEGVLLEIRSELIEQQNWNATWESQFEPIVVNEKCVIRAPFHPASDREFDIIISPKMSFGTGHHETTFLMSQRLFEIELRGKSLMDMGCGTGVLAIIARLLEANPVEGVDVEEWAYLNSMENAEMNHCEDIQFYHGDAGKLYGKKFDVLLANINRNILSSDMPLYAEALTEGGFLLVSGFYTTDVELLKSRAEECGLKFVNSTSKNDWALIQFKK